MKEQKELLSFAHGEVSKEFFKAFSPNTSTNAPTSCLCGRTHISDEFSPDDADDEVEIEKLRTMHETGSEAVVSHSGYIYYFHLRDEMIVFGCPCGYDRHFENQIKEHALNILEYLEAISKKRKKHADSFRKKVKQTKKAVKQ